MYTLVSAKKSQKLFEIIDIQFVVDFLGVNGFEITFADVIRLLCIKILSFLPN